MSWYDALMPHSIKRRKVEQSSVPEGVWIKCEGCGMALHDAEFAKSIGVCRKCNYHHRLDPLIRARSVFDPDCEIQEIAVTLKSCDFLGFSDLEDYKNRIKRYTKKADPGREALRVYQGLLGGMSTMIGCFDWSYMGGSMGSVVGERFVRAVDTACDRGTPFIVFSTSGGARMQEGLLSLMQMAKTTSALNRLSSQALPYISVLCNPTTGGVAASFAMVADIIIAEPKATVGFAGERVIRQTVREELPQGFQRSEFLLEHGSIDMIIDRTQLRNLLIQLCKFLREGKKNSG